MDRKAMNVIFFFAWVMELVAFTGLGRRDDSFRTDGWIRLVQSEQFSQWTFFFLFLQ